MNFINRLSTNKKIENKSNLFVFDYKNRQKSSINIIDKQITNKPHITIVKIKCMIYIMNIIKEELIEMGWECSLIDSKDINYYINSNNPFHYFLFLIPLQITDEVINYKRYILYQLEQNINNEISVNYEKVKDLQYVYDNAALLIDYCDTNINVTKKYYSNDFKRMNVPARIKNNHSENYEYDIIFVGFIFIFINERRKNILNKLKESYKVLIVENIYGDELKMLCNKSNICLNIHYYENAILERVRLNEMMEYGIKIISETPCMDDMDICKMYESIHFIEIINELNLEKLIETIEKIKYNNIDYKNNLNKLTTIFKNDIKILNMNNFIKNSFDIFDTIIARQCKNPSDIFDIIENEYPYKNFKNIRLESERIAYNQYNINMNIDHIYEIFKSLTNEHIDFDLLKEYEINKELEYSIPITSNINKIKNGDIYVSDMYLKPEHIYKLLSLHNINIDNLLFVTSGGKANGYIYEKLLKKYSIETHTGDNHHSDIVMAQKYKINTCYTTISSFTSTETILYNLGYIDFQKSIRKYRLANPYQEKTNEYELYHQQITYNIPLLILFSIEIKNILDKEILNKVLFFTRDCCLLYKIFNKIYPDIEIMEYASSRIVHKDPSIGYINYMKKHYTEDSIIIDLNGSFKSGRNIYMDTFGYLPRVHLFMCDNIINLYNGLTYTTSNTKNVNYFHYIETLNYDVKGTLLTIIDDIELRSYNENNESYIKISHQTVENYLNCINLRDINLNMDTSIIKDIYLNIFKDNNNLFINKSPSELYLNT